MAERLTDKVVRALPAPATGNKLHYDAEVKGFAARVTAAGARAFVLNYRAGGRERRYTIGSFPEWTTAALLHRPLGEVVRVTGTPTCLSAGRPRPPGRRSCWVAGWSGCSASPERRSLRRSPR